MVTMFKPKPQLFRLVEKPDNVSTKELAEARPVYMDGLEAGGNTPVAVADVTGLQAILDDYEARIAALEAASAG